MKCKHCGLDIAESELHRVEQRDRQGNIKTTKTGKVLYFNFHQTCFLYKQKEAAEWNNLYEYLRDKYFVTMVPSALIKDLRDFRKFYDFKIILGCLENVESSLLKNYEKIDFDNDFQRSRYITSCISNNIQTYKEKQDKKVIEVEETPIINICVTKTNTQKNNLNIISNEEDYDILD